VRKAWNFYFWIARRLLFNRKSQLFSLSGLNALIGLVLGVSCLVVSMAVMSGFESTLQASVADVSGHIQVLIKTADAPSKEDLLLKIKEIEPTLVAGTRFNYLEAVVAHQQKLSGVVLQGLDPEDVNRVLGLEKRLTDGTLDLSENQAVIGQGLAQKMNLAVGDEFKAVLPLRNDLDPTQFRRKIATFKVAGILDLGKYDYNQRMILTSIETTQKLSEVGKRFSGLLLKFERIEDARAIGAKLSKDLGPGFVIKDWREVNENLFEAVAIERIVVFFVILIIIIAAAFNVASTLYINVVTKFSEIALLKSLGLSRNAIVQIFSFQGFLIGLVGLSLGVVIGVLLCFVFAWAEAHFQILPGSIYKIDRIDLSLRFKDLLSISLATLTICVMATLAPAFRGARLSPVEGLRNE
jgi:lipoprotein-releasing system permease protein